MKLDFNFVKACKETEVELDGVIRSLGGKYRGPKTIVTYQNGDIAKYLIEGELGEESIPEKTNAIKVEIGTSVTSIGNEAFHGCSRLTSITIPDSVTSIRHNAFSGCSELTSVTIPDSVTSIYSTAFYECSKLVVIVVDSNNPFFDSRDNCNAIIRIADNKLICGCQNTVIPNSVKAIGESSFEGCSGLMSIMIPSSVRTIEASAFAGCSNLTSITCNAITAPTTYSFPFGGRETRYTGRNTYSTGNNVLTIPLGATGYDTSYWANQLLDSSKCGFHIDYIIPKDHDETVVRFNDGTVSAYNIVGSIEMYNVQSIELSKITKIDIGNTVTEIGNASFMNCSNLTSVTIPSTVTTIGFDIFYDINALKSIVIPKTITLIKSTAFNSSALETITFIDRTISEVQAMQYYSWHLTTCSHGIASMQRTIVCTDGTFTINATENHEPV